MGDRWIVHSGLGPPEGANSAYTDVETRIVSDGAHCVSVTVILLASLDDASINIDISYVLIVPANASVLIFHVALQGNIS
jgi:hypothetical protein